MTLTDLLKHLAKLEIRSISEFARLSGLNRNHIYLTCKGGYPKYEERIKNSLQMLKNDKKLDTK